MIRISILNLWDAGNVYTYKVNHFDGSTSKWLFIDIPPFIKDWLLEKNIYYEFDESFFQQNLENVGIDDVNNGSYYHLIFENEQDALLFKLTWC